MSLKIKVPKDTKVILGKDWEKPKKWETLCKKCGGEKVFTEGYRGTYCICKDTVNVEPKKLEKPTENVDVSEWHNPITDNGIEVFVYKDKVVIKE